MSFTSHSFVFRSGRLPVRLRWVVLGWIAAEIVTFAALVHLIGLGLTLLLGFATTVLGIVLMRRLGMETMRGLRRSVEGGQPPDGALAEGLLAALGAVLLLVPGFLANAVGLALSAPSGRRSVLRTFGGVARGDEARRVRRPNPIDVIDLGPDDWTPVDRR